MGKLSITLKKSPLSFEKSQGLTAEALGLTKVGKTIVQPDNASVWGMVTKIKHLVQVSEVEDKMNLCDLRPAEGSTHRRKKIGRGPGSGHGKTCGRGHKGDKARGQSKVGFEGGQTPLHRRLPKQRGIGVGLTARGFNTGRYKTHYNIVNLGALDARFGAGATIDPDTLAAAGVVRSNGLLLKVLAEGTLTKALTIRAHKFSAGALAAIEAAGGTAETL